MQLPSWPGTANPERVNWVCWKGLTVSHYSLYLAQGHK